MHQQPQTVTRVKEKPVFSWVCCLVCSSAGAWCQDVYETLYQMSFESPRKWHRIDCDNWLVVDGTWREPCWVSVRISLNAECLETDDYVLHNLADNAGEGDRPVVWHTILFTQLLNWQDGSLFSLWLYCVSVITLMAKEQSRKQFAPSVELAANGAHHGGCVRCDKTNLYL